MDKNCVEDYERRWDVFFYYSGAQVAGKPVFESGDTEEGWMARRFSLAETQLEGCWSIGGRYWEVDFQTANYVDSLRLAGINCQGWNVEAHGYTCGGWLREFDLRCNALPRDLTGGFCAPANCTRQHMRTHVFPKYLAQILRMDFPIPPPDKTEFDAKEMSHWSRYKLDFVIGGINSCGTTSLYTNLVTNPDIDFTMAEEFKEDGLLFLNNRVLPYAEDVTAFNSLWQLSGRPAPRLRGLDHPELFRFYRLREALRRFGGLKVVMVVCDPLSRFEKLFWRYYFCHPGVESWAAPKGPDGEPLCWPSAAAALTEPEHIDRWRFGETLRAVQATYGPRLHVVHQDSLRHRPREAYDRMAKFLGAAPFPEGVQFRRMNSVRGARTGLCGNASLVRALQERLADEYAALEEVLRRAGEPLPESLRQRRTRCDRTEELLPAAS